MPEFIFDKNVRGPGLFPSPKDDRDYKYSAFQTEKVDATTLPKRYEIDEKYCRPIKDQGKFGTCGGKAGANNKEAQFAMYQGVIRPLSALFVYCEAKKIDGLPNDEGTTLRAVLNVLHKIGVCEEGLFPYHYLTDVKRLPVAPDKCFDNAANHKIGAYAKLNTIEEIKHALVTKQSPVLAGVFWLDYFDKPKEGKYLISPEKGQRVYVRGGHAVNFVGYDDTMTYGGETGFIKIENSHGADYGSKGYVWVSYKVLMTSYELLGRVLMEAWSTVGTGFRRQVEVFEGSNIMLVNGVEKKLDFTPRIENGRFVGPFADVLRQAGITVEWDSANKRAILHL